MTAPTEGQDESTWTKLRRRKVVQWGIAYSAGAWGFLQGLEYVSEAFGWPGQLRQVAILALLIGLPIVLVIAWYHGDRGEQRVGGAEFAIITLLFVLGGGIFWRYEGTSDAPVAGPVPASAVARADGRPSIAVLPFENRSRIDDDAFFVDGIHDDILTQLTKISAMKVIAPDSVAQFRDTRITAREIGRKLDVSNLLEGGVQRAGDRVRVTVRLVDAASEAHVWAENYDRELTAANIFAIQSEVATAVAMALKTELTEGERARVGVIPTQNLEAWEAYQLGRQRMDKRTSADLADAEKLFRKAIELDPEFALAYTGLADTLVVQIMYSGAPRESALSDAGQAVAVALQLDRNLAEAWLSSGAIATAQRQYDRAEPDFRRAIELNPNSATAHGMYSFMLREVGRLDESLAEIQRAVDLDPLSALSNETLGGRLAELGRFREAEASLRRSITIDPSRPGTYVGLALIDAYALDKLADAVAVGRKAVQLDPGGAIPATVLPLLYFDLGDDKAFIDATAQAAKRWPGDRFVQSRLAMIDLLRSDVAGAVRHAQRALDVYHRYDWALAILRDADLQNGRYDAALARYETAYPELFEQRTPRVDRTNNRVAVDVATVFQRRGDVERARALLDGAARVNQTVPRLSIYGFGIADVQAHALRGQKADALAALREAERAGWRYWWRYHRDFDPALASIRNDPEFKAIFARIEADVARQRAALAARPKDAPLDLGAWH